MSIPTPHDRINVIEYLRGDNPENMYGATTHELCRTAFDDGFAYAMVMVQFHLSPCSKRMVQDDMMNQKHPYDVLK